MPEKLKQCKIHLAYSHILPFSYYTLSLLEASRDNLESYPILDTIAKVQIIGTGEAGRPTSAEQNTANAAALVVIQQITKPPSPAQVITSDSAKVVVDSDDPNKVRAQVGASTSTKKEQVGIFKPVP